jgi:carboxypeptidase Taq
MPPAAFTALKLRLEKIHDLASIQELLEWDQRTMMPAGGAAARIEQIASIERARHERFASIEIGELLEQCRSYEDSLPPEHDDAALIRVVRRDFEKQVRIPSGLLGQLSRAAALAEQTWVEARRRSDFELLLPQLEQLIELKRAYIACFEYADPYDALLDDFEPGMRTAEIAQVLDELKSELVPLVHAVAANGDSVDDSFLHADFPIDAQRALVKSILSDLPIAPENLRLDDTAHPFSSSLSITDIRITTRYDPRNLASSIFSALHEFGHGLYSSGAEPALERTPLADASSLGLHESQSRMWENAVGRCLAFWRHFYPRVKAAFPNQLGGVSVEDFQRAVNKVERSLIRVEADELTYDLHVILRFELEQEIFHNGLDLRDLPTIWAEKVNDYLGLEVPDDAHGVLQDVHWADGAFGYFPTYSLGNVVRGQLWQAAKLALPELDEQIERGDFAPLREWLRENVHRHGRKLTAAEVVERVTGGPFEVAPYVSYLRDKAGAIYDLA